MQTREPAAPAAAAQPRRVLADVTEGLRACWQDRELRTCFLYWSVVALLVSGPVQVAMPVLASAQLGVGCGRLRPADGRSRRGTLAGMAFVASPMPRVRDAAPLPPA